jgi:phage terminase large subunit-like protein
MANSFAAQLADALGNSWAAVARPNQLPPAGDWWQIWLLLAGRGFGKTRTLAEWVCEQVASGQASRIALVAATAADARDVLVEGESGILAVAPPQFRPIYEPSKRRLTWPNGAMSGRGASYPAPPP